MGRDYEKSAGMKGTRENKAERGSKEERKPKKQKYISLGKKQAQKSARPHVRALKNSGESKRKESRQKRDGAAAHVVTAARSSALRRNPFAVLCGKQAEQPQVVMNRFEEKLQPRNKDYGGQGLAQESAWLPLPCHEHHSEEQFSDTFSTIYGEHVKNFYGKTKQAKADRTNSSMEWRERLQVKQSAIAAANGGGEGSGAAGEGGAKGKKRKKGAAQQAPGEQARQQQLKLEAQRAYALMKQRRREGVPGGS